MLLRCDQIVTPQGTVDGAILVREGIVEKIIGKEEIDESASMVDYRGKRILPGLIDIHTHGYLGWKSQDTDPQSFHHLARAMASIGVSGFYVTAGEHCEDEMENLRAIADAMDQQKQGLKGEARILGIHMEGPFLNPQRKGAFAAEQLLDVSFEKMEAYVKASRNNIRYMTMAPELDPEGKMIRWCHDHNILVTGGHTVATFEQYSKGIEQGLSCSTHTGNAMRQMDRRDPGAYGAALLSDKIMNEVICDLFHISEPMLEIMFRIKNGGMDRFIMISDSGSMSGMPSGTYVIDGRNRTISPEGLVVLDNGTISGSSKNMMYGVRNLEKIMHKPITKIIRMTSENPAALFGLSQKGSIEEGKDADLVVIDENYHVLCTYVEGQKIVIGENEDLVNPQFFVDCPKIR